MKLFLWLWGWSWIGFAAGPLTTEEFRAPQTSDPQPMARSQVGFPAVISQLWLPGPAIQVRPNADRSAPISLRIVDRFAHGDGFRYDLEFTGWEPGRFDLRNYFDFSPDSPPAPWPPILVDVYSGLPEGQQQPASLSSRPPRVGGRYVALAVAAAGLWILGLFLILGWGQGQTRQVQRVNRVQTLADRLRPIVERAARGELSSAEFAEVERLLLACWRRQLRLENLPPTQAIAAIKRDPQAGQLLTMLETWLHSPEPATPVDFSQLLAPYQTTDWEALERP